MKCPHLIKWVLFTCKATEPLYFPSAFQLQEYCRHKNHRKCPFLSASASREHMGDAVPLTGT